MFPVSKCDTISSNEDPFGKLVHGKDCAQSLSSTTSTVDKLELASSFALNIYIPMS